LYLPVQVQVTQLLQST